MRATCVSEHCSMNMKVLIAGAALFLPLSPVVAQDSDDLRVRVGLGAQIRPEYLGADKSEVGPLWDLSIARGTEPFGFEAPDDNFDIKLFSSGDFSFGPVVNVQSGRKNSDVGVAIGKVPTTIEAGLFAQYEVTETIRLRSEVRKGIGGHEGLVASIGGDRIWRDGDRYVFSIGPRVLLSNARYHRAFFGIGPDAALTSGLPQYRPNGGVHAIALTSGLTYQLNRRWGLFGYARYELLVGEAAKSPVVRELGSENQAYAGLGLTYTFNIKR